MRKGLALREKLAEQSVGMLVEPPFPRVVRVGKVARKLTQRRTGKDLDLLASRNMTLALAREKHPLRWGCRPAKLYTAPAEVVLNGKVA